MEHHSDPTVRDGFSLKRESYMISNFIYAYDRCGTEKIMGIFGSAHTDLRDPDLMAGRLKSHYGDVISSVRISTVLLPDFQWRGLPFR